MPTSPTSLQAVFAATPVQTFDVAVIATTWDGKVGYWNGAAERFYGWSAEEVIGRDIGEITYIDDNWGSIGEEIMAELRAGKPWAGTFPVKCRSGFPVEVFVIDTPLPAIRPEHCAIVGISAPAGLADRVRERNEILLYELRRHLEMSAAAPAATDAAALDYRLYLMDQTGRIGDARDGRFADDDEAAAFGRRYLGAAAPYYSAIEVWQRGRLARRLTR